MDATRHVLLCPKNDPESLQILEVASVFHIPTLVSHQQHGAKLVHEPHLIDRIKTQNALAKTIVIVEIPGLPEEDALRARGYCVDIIDHHAYGDLDRTSPQSSLEQVLSYFAISDNDLVSHGLDPLLVRGVGVIDRGFLWELAREGYNEKEAARIRTHYAALGKTLERENAITPEQAMQIWNAREERDGVIILRSSGVTRSGIRNAMSYILAEASPSHEPPVIIIENDKVVVQGIDCGEELLRTFGGYLFGSAKCWGKQDSPKNLPSVDAILDIVRKP